MTQNLRGRAAPPNIAKQVWAFCVACGKHRKTAEYRHRFGETRCDDCLDKPRRFRRWWR